jgi:hypothetical protein
MMALVDWITSLMIDIVLPSQMLVLPSQMLDSRC